MKLFLFVQPPISRSDYTP